MAADLSAPMPRVSGELLARFVGRKVLLVGKQESMDSGVMHLRTCDGRLVRVTLKSNAASYDSDYVEFEAKVDSAESVTEMEHTSFSSTFGARCVPSRHRVCRTAVPSPHPQRSQSTSARPGQLQRAREAHEHKREQPVPLKHNTLCSLSECCKRLRESPVPPVAGTARDVSAALSREEKVWTCRVLVPFHFMRCARIALEAYWKPQGRQSEDCRASSVKPAAWPSEPQAMTSTWACALEQ